MHAVLSYGGVVGRYLGRPRLHKLTGVGAIRRLVPRMLECYITGTVLTLSTYLLPGW